MWAYGPLCLRPAEFEELQPQEFYLLLEGWLWRQAKQKAELKSSQERAESVAAYFVAYLLNVSGKSLKRKVTHKDLMRPLLDKPRTGKHTDAEESEPAENGGDQDGDDC